MPTNLPVIPTNVPANDIVSDPVLVGAGPALSADASKIVYFTVPIGSALNDLVLTNLHRSSGSGPNVIRPDGSRPIVLTSGLWNYSPAFSPDGRRVAFVSNRDGNAEIYIMDIATRHPLRLTNNPATDTHPTFSPDGQQIAFESERDGQPAIYVMTANGKNVQRLTTGADAEYPSWGG